MSEPIGTCIEIGGALPASLIEAFLECVENDIDNCIGPYTREMLEEEVDGTTSIRYDGTVDKGICNELIRFCKRHNLTYVTHAEARGEYEADTSYWSPGMEMEESFKTNSDNNPIIDASDIKPVIDLMYAMVIDGKRALPLFTNDGTVAGLVKLGLDNYPEFLIQLRATIDSHFPKDADSVPPFVIDRNS
jgi:hypothetical protein